MGRGISYRFLIEKKAKSTPALPHPYPRTYVIHGESRPSMRTLAGSNVTVSTDSGTTMTSSRARPLATNSSATNLRSGGDEKGRGGGGSAVTKASTIEEGVVVTK